MTIKDILNQNKRGHGYYRESWQSAFLQMNYTSGIYMLYEVKGGELIKSAFEFSDEDMSAKDWQVRKLCELEYRLLSTQETNKTNLSAQKN